MKLIYKFIRWYPGIRVEFHYGEEFDAIYITFFYKHYICKQQLSHEYLEHVDESIVDLHLIDICNKAVIDMKYPLDEDAEDDGLGRFMDTVKQRNVEWHH